MNDTDSITLPETKGVIQSQLRKTARTQRHMGFLGQLLTLFGLIGFVVVAVAAALEPMPEWLRANSMTLAALGLIAGPILWVGSAGLQSHLRHYHAYKYDLDQVTEAINKSAIGRVVAMLEQNSVMLQKIREALDIKAGDEAFVDRLSAQEPPSDNGHKVTRLVRPAWPDGGELPRRR